MFDILHVFPFARNWDPIFQPEIVKTFLSSVLVWYGIPGFMHARVWHCVIQLQGRFGQGYSVGKAEALVDPGAHSSTSFPLGCGLRCLPGLHEEFPLLGAAVAAHFRMRPALDVN
jgi:hypothetical protein